MATKQRMLERKKLLNYHGDENVLFMPIKNGMKSNKKKIVYKKMTGGCKNNNWKSHCSSRRRIK